ncbi:MAG: ribose 5-phosphate isomerase B [Phycisphaerales bacterium]|jgi:ribose 5-phosphate isomerase B|tara:strand:+ start:715 stop:1212 length:498 start_codon:yes stop_codon:yes gene_type:complete
MTSNESESNKSFTIVIGSDHRGNTAAKQILETIKNLGHDGWIEGSCDDQPCDYPEKAWQVGQQVTSGKADRGVLICGTGIGMSIAANKIDGLRAALVHDELTAQLSRSHNDANILCLSADLLGARLMDKIVEVWIGTPFEGGRHQRRIDKITEIEHGRDPSVAAV